MKGLTQAPHVAPERRRRAHGRTMNRRLAVNLLVVLVVVFALVPARAEAAEHPIGPFVGDYLGHTISSGASGLTENDLSVSIRAADKGFVLKWTTITERADGTRQRRSFAMEFQPAADQFMTSDSSTAKRFAPLSPVAPLKGDPYVWARIEGGTLVVHIMLVIDDGGYEMQVFERTLTERGLNLKLIRVRNGRAFAPVTGSLLRFSG